MRFEFLYNPRLLCERVAAKSIRLRRLAKLQNTPARNLLSGHIDSLELVQLAERAEIGVIYDLGANVGTWTLLAKSFIPNAQIHAFEPLLKHSNVFAENTSGVENISFHQVALGAENVTSTIRVTNFSDASSMLNSTKINQSQFGIREMEQLTVQMRRLDDYRSERQLPYPDLMKLDVQGYELEVLKGAAECLRTVKAVIIEVSFIEYYERQCFFHEIVSHLAELNLFVRAFGVNTPLGAVVEQTDVLFMRP